MWTCKSRHWTMEPPKMCSGKTISNKHVFMKGGCSFRRCTCNRGLIPDCSRSYSESRFVSIRQHCHVGVSRHNNIVTHSLYVKLCCAINRPDMNNKPRISITLLPTYVAVPMFCPGPCPRCTG